MDNIGAAEELLAFLDPEKLEFEGREEDVPKELRQKVRFVKDLDSAIEHYNSDHGIEVFIDKVDNIHANAIGVIDEDAILKVTDAQLNKKLSSFSWGNLPIGLDTGGMLQIGDNTHYILSAVLRYRLALGKSSEFLERCVQLLELGFLPFGYDEEEDLLFAFSRPVD